MSVSTAKVGDYKIVGDLFDGSEEILTSDAMNFVISIQNKFGDRRLELLQDRIENQASIDNQKFPDFLEFTRTVRESDWKVNPVPHDLQDRRVEITGPVDRKMIINALNSGVKVFMADFEDSNSPTWNNIVNGQINLKDANNRTISFTIQLKIKCMF